MLSRDYLPYIDLPSKLGIKKGDDVLLASDVTLLARKAIRQEGEFSTDKLIENFLQFVGPGGTLIIPSFNFILRNGDTFDPRETMPVTGALAESAMKRKDFARTTHPLHSFLVSGNYAEKLTRMDNVSSFGPDSPFGFFKEINVLMLMVGTSVTSAFTFVHHAEEMEKVRYRRYRAISLNYVDPNGVPVKRVYQIYAKKPGWTMDLSLLESLFIKRGVLREVSFNGVKCSMVRLGDAYPIIRDDILHNDAQNISRFSKKLYIREHLKEILSSLHLYSTLTEKISHAPGPR
jgi:aminoglycoside 3-N-acetyltransferase